VAHSYCRRIACLNPGVTFRVRIGGAMSEYKSTDGVRDLFDAISTPYQFLHQPIHVKAREGDLQLEAFFAFHSWTENRIWSFVNKGRAPDGGTHEAGLLEAIAGMHGRESTSVMGALAVMLIDYPHATYEGCIKARIGNPELREGVRTIVAAGVENWLRDHPDEVEHLHCIERFQFGHVW
jgi:topoisomerase-4 subunit B